MKILFAVSNENISESIIKKYESMYKEIVSSKNVYYFNAILKELQKDKSYDRVVISEDLEPFTNKNYEVTDNFIFEKLDRISDEAIDHSGEDIPIIIIASDRRSTGDPILNKLFGIGIYSALLGSDRTIPNLCDLINKPRTKKEAKAYYRIDTSDTDYKAESENDVSEIEIQNILAHYKRLGKNEDKYVESFNSIANQYNDQQLKVIVKFLPIGVKAVLEAKSPKYQQIATFSGENASLRSQRPYSSSQINPKTNKPRSTGQAVVDNGIKIESIGSKEPKRLTKPVVIPGTVSTQNVRKIQSNSNGARLQNTAMNNKPQMRNNEEQQVARPEVIPNEETPNTQDQQPMQNQSIAPQTNENVERVGMDNMEEMQERRGRGRPRKVLTPEEIAAAAARPKRRRGRPRKFTNQEDTQDVQSVLSGLDDFDNEDEYSNGMLPGFNEGQEDTNVAKTNNIPNTHQNNQPVNNVDGIDDEYDDEFDEFDDFDEDEITNNQPSNNQVNNARQNNNVQYDEDFDNEDEYNDEYDDEYDDNEYDNDEYKDDEEFSDVDSEDYDDEDYDDEASEDGEYAEEYEDEEFDDLDDFDIDDDFEDEQKTSYARKPESTGGFLPGFDTTDEDNILTFDEPDELPGFEEIERDLPKSQDNYQLRDKQQTDRPEKRSSYNDLVNSYDDEDDFDDDNLLIGNNNNNNNNNNNMMNNNNNSFNNNNSYSNNMNNNMMNNSMNNSMNNMNNSMNSNMNNNETQIQSYSNNAPNNSLSGLMSANRKVVAFVGTSKNGTSFLINNLADMFSKQGIRTAILDLTKNRNSYYIYTKNEENLRKIATQCLGNLAMGTAQGIPVAKNLDVYTALPGENNQDAIAQYDKVLTTLINTYSLVLLDCDFSTDIGYLRESQEIYLVQSMDVLTIQPFTAYLRDLKAKNVLEQEKLRIVVNKYTRVRSVTEKTIIGGLAFYNDPSMSFMTELFNRESIRYTVVPFEVNTYAKYLEGLINCNINVSVYPKEMLASLNRLAGMVYPLINGGGMPKQNKYNNATYNSYSNANTFSSQMNDTLDKMKRSF